jgi:hypothetical protein
MPRPQWLDDGMICAANCTLADEIIVRLEPRKRAEVGISGLAKRVRQKLKGCLGSLTALGRCFPFARRDI